jgi:cobalt ECF transporter T component CbiQ
MPEKTIRRPKSFIEKTITGLAEVAEQALYAESLAKENGLLQSLDARVKVIGLIALIIAAALSKKITIILSLLALAILLALLSKIPFRSLVQRVWLSAFLFTGVITLPAIFITPGEVIYRLPVLHWSVTEQGLRSAIYLLSRVETAATFAALIVLTTPWMQVLKALRTLGIPVVFVVIFGMTHRYIFLMLQTARDMFESRQSRIIGKLTGADSRRLAAASVGVLLSKSFYFSNEIYQAMQSRGFRGEVYLLDEFQMQSRDWLALVMFLIIAIVAFLFS